MISDCSSRFSSVCRSDRIAIVTLSKSIISAALGAWGGGSLCAGRGRWLCCCVISNSVLGSRPSHGRVAPQGGKHDGAGGPGRALVGGDIRRRWCRQGIGEGRRTHLSAPVRVASTQCRGPQAPPDGPTPRLLICQTA